MLEVIRGLAPTVKYVVKQDRYVLICIVHTIDGLLIGRLRGQLKTLSRNPLLYILSLNPFKARSRQLPSRDVLSPCLR